MKIHYDGWSDKWDEYCDYAKELNRFAKAGSVSTRPAHRFTELRKGDYVDVNPIRFDPHYGWCQGQIESFCKNSGQVCILYYYQGKQSYYWTHLDNTKEVAEFAKDV